MAYCGGGGGAGRTAPAPAPSSCRLRVARTGRPTGGAGPLFVAVVPEVVIVGYNFGVGREAPLFDLTAHDGSRITLKQYRGDWFPVIVFLAGEPAAAAPVVTSLSAAADQLWGYRGQLVGVVHGDAEAARAVAAAADRAEFPLVPDPDADVARAYGAWDAGSGTQRAYAVIVDRAGKIVWAADGRAAAVKPADIVAGMKAAAR